MADAMASRVTADVAVQVRGLRKSYGALVAVDGIDLEIGRGEIFALLGPNGAGKTTTVEILEGYRQRDAGEVSVLGFDPGTEGSALKTKIGIVLQSTGIDRYLTVMETLEMYAGYFPHPRDPEEVLGLVGLEDKRDARIQTLSGGLQRRLDVGVALVGDPDLLFLDEPTTGFDPSARRESWHVVKNLAALGKTVLLTTHYMDEAQFLADRVAVIAAGHLVAEGTPASLAGRDQAQTRIAFTLPSEIAVPERFGATRSDGDRVELAGSDLVRTLHELTGWALGEGLAIEDLTVSRPSLEDVYLEVTGAEAMPPANEAAASTRRHRRSRTRR